MTIFVGYLVRGTISKVALSAGETSDLAYLEN